MAPATGDLLAEGGTRGVGHIHVGRKGQRPGGLTQLCREHGPNQAPWVLGRCFWDLGRGGTLGSFCFSSLSGSILPELGGPSPKFPGPV